MELKASKVVTALDFLQVLAQNPLQSVSSKNKSVLDEIRKSYFPISKELPKNAGRKRKQSPSKLAPKPKRQRVTRSNSNKSKRSEARQCDKEENDDDDNDNNDNNDNVIISDDISDNDDEDETELTEQEIDDDDDDQFEDNLTLIEDHAMKKNIAGNSPSHFSYFNENEGIFITEKGSLSPLWSRGEPRHNDLDNYLQSVAKIFYHPIEAMDHHLNIQKEAYLNKNKNEENEDKKPKKRGRKPKHKNNKKNKSKNGKNNNNCNDDEFEKILRYSTINLILSPLRKRSPLDEWNPREIALFESAMCSKGKQFYEISKIINTKNTKQCVEFYYHWKQSSHYAVWKALGRKTNKQISKSQKKLHKRIGQKFADFHSIYAKKQNNNNNNNGNHNNHNHNNNNSMIMQQQQQQQNNVNIGYYPHQYYQNGYPWYANTAYTQHTQQQYQQYFQQQQQAQISIKDKSPNGSNHNINNNGNGTNNNHNNNHNHNEENKKSDFIDLTETASSNGSRSPKDINDHNLIKKQKEKKENNIVVN